MDMVKYIKNMVNSALSSIILTADGQAVDEKKGFDAGANKYILKPFDPRAILQRVKEITSAIP